MCVFVSIKGLKTDVGLRWSLSSDFYGKTGELGCCDVFAQKGVICYLDVEAFLVNTFLETTHRDFEEPISYELINVIIFAVVKS